MTDEIVLPCEVKVHATAIQGDGFSKINSTPFKKSFYKGVAHQKYNNGLYKIVIQNCKIPKTMRYQEDFIWSDSIWLDKE
jgi:hypothetical protein